MLVSKNIDNIDYVTGIGNAVRKCILNHTLIIIITRPLRVALLPSQLLFFFAGRLCEKGPFVGPTLRVLSRKVSYNDVQAILILYLILLGVLLIFCTLYAIKNGG